MEQGENTGTLPRNWEWIGEGLYRWRQPLDPERQPEAKREREAVLAKEVETVEAALAEKVLEFWIFSKGACNKIERDAGGRKHWREGHLRPDPGS